MALNKIPVVMLAQNDTFASRALAEAAALGAIGAGRIFVTEATEIVLYRQQAGASDLIGVDGSTWKRGSITQADLVAALSDAAEVIASITRLSGDWTPALSFSGGGGSFTYVTRAGRYRAIDGLAHIECAISCQITSLGTGNLRLSGLVEGLRPMAGVIPGYLQMPVKGAGFFIPYGAAEIGLSWTPGAGFGVFNYYGSSGQMLQYVTGVTGSPGTGDYQLVEWAGGSGRLEDWRPDPAVAGAGRMSLINVIGAMPTGTVTGAGWTATAAGAWQGAPVGERFLNATNLAVGMQLDFVLAGHWRIA